MWTRVGLIKGLDLDENFLHKAVYVLSPTFFAIRQNNANEALGILPCAPQSSRRLALWRLPWRLADHCLTVTRIPLEP